MGRPGDHGLRSSRGTGTGTGAPGGAEGWSPSWHRLHHGQQDVRLGDGGGHACARSPRCRERGHHRRRRHGEHEQRSLPAAQGSRRHAHGARDGIRPHVPRWPRGRLRQRHADGRIRRGVRRQVSIHPRAAGRVRVALTFAGAARERGRHFRLGDCAGHRRGPQGRRGRRSRRATGESESREDSDAQAGFPQGRHGYCSEFQLDLRRRGCAGPDAPVDCRAQGPAPAGADPRSRDARAGAWLVHDGPGRSHAEALREARLDRRRCGLVRDQRSVCSGHDGGDAGILAGAGEG